jgi:DHA2 family multidrug resistance protein-like MFS transporter
LGIAALGSLATIAYRTHLTVPSGIPLAADHAARQGITAATDAAQHLPQPLGPDLLDAARNAFTTGLTAVAGVGATVFTGLALLAALAFRHVPPTGTDPSTLDVGTQAESADPTAVDA